MPCESDYRCDASELRVILDSTTRAACEMRLVLRSVGLEKDLTAETRKWIYGHDELDAVRLNSPILTPRKSKVLWIKFSPDGCVKDIKDGDVFQAESQTNPAPYADYVRYERHK